LNPDSKKWFELLAVLITGLLKIIIMDWLEMRAFYIVCACLFWSVYVIINYKRDHTFFKQWGFHKENFRQSFLFILPVAIVCIAIISIYGIINNTAVINLNFILVFILYPVFGLFQQFMMIGLIAGNLTAIEKIRFKKYQVIIITAVIFSLIHYTSYSLMIYTFFLELIFVWVYLKWRNLWSLGLYHGWIATFLLFYVPERNLWTELFLWFQI